MNSPDSLKRSSKLSNINNSTRSNTQPSTPSTSRPSRAQFWGAVFGIIAATILSIFLYNPDILSPLGRDEADLDLAHMSISRLKQSQPGPSEITIGKELEMGIDVPTYQIFFTDTSFGDRAVSATLTLPPEPGEYPVILMLRGYVDKEIYYPGIGTKRAAEYFAQNGYITIAPDFLGYGASDDPVENTLGARFQGYSTALTLLNSLDNINAALEESEIESTDAVANNAVANNTVANNAEASNVAAESEADSPDLSIYSLNTELPRLWGHSNGGHIALVTLAVTGEKLPTTLWAPVTQSFPDSILEYADELPDKGKYLKGIVNDFKKDYNITLYDPAEFYRWIKAPIQLHQGTADEYVTPEMSLKFAETMKKLGNPITYYEYPDADHNLQPGWDTVVARDVQFFAQ